MGRIDVDQDNSSDANRKLEAAVDKALEMIGGLIESAAKEQITANGSVDTGLLRNSITYALGGEYAATEQYTNNAGGTSKSGKQIVERTGTYEAQAPADEKGTRTVYVGSNVEYAPFIELGTSKMSAKPFLRPAVENNKQKIQRAIELCLKDA